MSAESQLFKIDPATKEIEPMDEVEFARLGLQERQDIQEWVAGNPSILEENLLIIGKEFSSFDKTNERLDLLAVDSEGRLVVIELRRPCLVPGSYLRPWALASATASRDIGLYLVLGNKTPPVISAGNGRHGWDVLGKKYLADLVVGIAQSQRDKQTTQAIGWGSG